MNRDLIVVWHFGNVCNARCSYCLNADAMYSNFINMNAEQTDRIIALLNTLPVKRVDMLGGEPTCFEHLQTAARQLSCTEFMLTTNGLRPDVVEETALSRKCIGDGKVHLCVSVHGELVELDPVGFRENLTKYITMARTGTVRLIIKLVINGGLQVLTNSFVDIVNYLLFEHKNGGFELEATFVRIPGQDEVTQFIAAYHLASHVSQECSALLMRERADILRPNPWQGKTCPIFRHYMEIDVDGKLSFGDCPNACYASTHSVFDVDFEWNNEVQYCTCTSPHMTCNGLCYMAHDCERGEEP